MGIELASYMKSNYFDILLGAFFCIMGYFLGVLGGEKKDNKSINNFTTYEQMQIIIVNKYYCMKASNQQNHIIKNTKSQNKNEASVGELFILAIIIASIYSKYHSLIIDAIFLFTLFVLALILSLTINLNRNSQLDKMNKKWIILCLIIIIYNFASLIILNSQEMLINHGIESYSLILTYAFGFVFQLWPNAILLLIVTYLMAMNKFLKEENKINRFLVLKLNWLTKKSKFIILFVVAMLIISLFYSTGQAYNIFQI